MNFRGKAHLVGNPRNPTDNRLKPPGGSGDRVAEAVAVEKNVEAGRGTQVTGTEGPPPKEGMTSSRISKRHPRVKLRWRQKRMSGRMKRGQRQRDPKEGTGRGYPRGGDVPPPRGKYGPT